MATFPRLCGHCEREFITNRRDKRFCSAVCRVGAWQAQNPERVQARLEAVYEVRRTAVATMVQNCPYCHRDFQNDRKRKYCSTPCLKRAQNTSPSSRAAKARRAARERGAAGEGETFGWMDLIARDGKRCMLCRKPLNLALSAPHPMAPSLDHVVPIALGGRHEMRNAQLVHMRCNSIKGIRPMNEQLRLV